MLQTGRCSLLLALLGLLLHLLCDILQELRRAVHARSQPELRRVHLPCLQRLGERFQLHPPRVRCLLAVTVVQATYEGTHGGWALTELSWVFEGDGRPVCSSGGRERERRGT
jgi:hypothetical protein